jgi:hypothetical protein
MVTQTEKRMDWHLFWAAAGVVLTLGILIIGCYSKHSSEISDVNKEIVKIQTVMIIKGIAPAELFATNEEIRK